MTDLTLAVGVTVGAILALLVPGVPWPIEWAFGIPFLVVLPGYVLVAALAPAAPDRSRTEPGASLGWAARAGLALVLSAVVVAGVGVLLATQGLLRLEPAVLLLSGVSLVGVVAAAIRRRSVPVSRRADPVAGVSSAGGTGWIDTTKPQTVLLVVGLVALAGALAFAGGTAGVDDPYSEVYLSPQADGGAAGNGTMTLVAGEDNPVELVVENHEGHETSYNVVIQLQRVDSDGTVLDQQRLDRFDVRLGSNESGVAERSLSPSMTGERLRLRTLVYTGGAPDDATADNADLSLRHWVTVVGEEPS